MNILWGEDGFAPIFYSQNLVDGASGDVKSNSERPFLYSFSIGTSKYLGVNIQKHSLNSVST